MSRNSWKYPKLGWVWASVPDVVFVSHLLKIETFLCFHTFHPKTCSIELQDLIVRSTLNISTCFVVSSCSWSVCVSLAVETFKDLFKLRDVSWETFNRFSMSLCMWPLCTLTPFFAVVVKLQSSHFNSLGLEFSHTLSSSGLDGDISTFSAVVRAAARFSLLLLWLDFGIRILMSIST